MSYLDKTGLTYLWQKIKAKIPTKTSDLTNDSFITDVKLNNTSVSSNKQVNLSTKSTYNSSTNRLATELDLDYVPTDSLIVWDNSTPIPQGYEEYGSLADLVYPVGSIYLSVNSTSPATLFGGTWEQIKDVFLLSAGDTYSAGDTGGEATHKLTVDEMPAHNHPFNNGGSALVMDCSTAEITDGFSSGVYWNGAKKARNGIANRGGGQAHNNMPPYLTVYMWKRTA